MDQLQALKLFTEVARHRSFSRAARELQVSPSVATRAVAQLEQRLGLRLLQRTTRSLRLTERGRTYRELVRRLLQDLEDAERRVRGEDAEPRGELRLTVPLVFGRLHGVPMVQRLLAEYPALTVRLMLSDRNEPLVDAGLDAAVRIGELEDSGLIALKLGSVRRVTVASPAYLARRGTPRSPRELAKHDLIAFENLDTTSDWRFAQGAAVQVRPRLRVDSADAAIAAAEAGLGIARALSYQVRAAVDAGRLVKLLGAHAPAAVPVSIVYPGQRSASANVAAFVKAARAHLAQTRLD